MKLLNLVKGWKAYKPEFSAEVSLSSSEIFVLKSALQGKEAEAKELFDKFSGIEKAILEEVKNLE